MSISKVPLTHSQMMIWMGQQIATNSPLYNMILSFEFRGKINVHFFKTAFQLLVDNNDILRVFIDVKDGLPTQNFHKTKPSELQYIDLSNTLEAYNSYKDWVEKNKTKRFGLNEVLYDAVLFKIKEDHFIFYFNQHHLITDGWSMKLIYDELNTNYCKLLNGEEILSSEIHSFEKYAQKNTFSHNQEISSYWGDKLEKAPELSSLYGINKKNIASNSTRINFDLGKKRTKQIKEFTLDSDIRAWTMELALSNVFLTTLGVLIYKVGNHKEFSLGIPHHNRLSAKAKKTAGLYMELLPLHLKVEEKDTFLDFFKKIQEESMNVFKNMISDKPPVKLLKSFNVVLNFIPITYDNFGNIPTECNWLLSNHVDPNHHIRLQIQDFNNKEDYKLQFDLNNIIFSEEQRNYIGQHFITVLDNFIANKNTPIKDVSIISTSELKLLNKWNETTVDYNRDQTLLTKFHEQVLNSPDNTAILFDGKSLSYKELNDKSNQLANFLIEEGVVANTIVAISLERSLEMLICIYGIIKAGGAYLPLDTTTPKNRLNFILANAGAKMLLFNHDGIQVTQDIKTKTYHTTVLWDSIGFHETKEPSITINPKDLAYVIYTSGSTGDPKGVKCHHEGICNRLNWMDDEYTINQNDTLIQKTPITFDVSVWELFWPLQKGAKLVIEKPNGHINPEGLIHTIMSNEISVIHFVPSMLNIFINTNSVENCTSLKKIFCSGEALSVGIVTQTHKKLKAEIYNLYGPTEASVDVTHWHCNRKHNLNKIPIGYPVANTKLYILDKALNRVPIGVSGELYIGGVQVAQGYLNNQELTNERFINDIFSDNPEAKLYKTGDLARFKWNGALEYLGRTDTQIKLRGLRIELGEIEKTLENITTIKQAIVKVDKLNNQENLIAYYTGKPQEVTNLKNSLQEDLPNYMIPSFYMHLEKFHLLSSGKINRKKLPPIKIQVTTEEKICKPPTNELEEITMTIWKEVLQLKQIGINDNFIHLGGNSLNAMIITSRLKEAFELEMLKLVDVFNYPTIEKYANFIKKILIKLLEEEE